jgi:GTP-binding protein HflX
LDEVRDADILVVVNDGGDPLRDRQLMATEAVLKEVDASEIPQILVYNQSDRVDSAERHAPGLWISALTGEGIEELWEALRRQLLTGRQAIPIFVPWDHKETWQALYQSATIVRRVDVENGSWLAITCSPQHSHLFAGYESEQGTPPW